MPVLLHMWRHLSLGKQGLIETGSGTECTVSGTPLTFHPPLEVMQRWLDSSQTRGDESDWALIQYPFSLEGPWMNPITEDFTSVQITSMD